MILERSNFDQNLDGFYSKYTYIKEAKVQLYSPKICFLNSFGKSTSKNFAVKSLINRTNYTLITLALLQTMMQNVGRQ